MREKTGAQMAVLIVASTGGEAIEEFSMRVAEAWQGGDAERDDGLLLTLAMHDRRMRLEVGYGLEGNIPDAAARRIVDGMRDDLRAGDLASAIDGAISATARRIPRLDPSVLDGGHLARQDGVSTGLLVTVAAAVTALFFLFAGRGRTPKMKRRAGKRAKLPPLPTRGRREWTLLALAMTIVAGSLSWLFADIEGFPSEEPVAYLASAAVLVSLGRLIDKKARTLAIPVDRWLFFGPLFLELFLVTAGAACVFLGSASGLIFLGAAALLLVLVVPCVLASLGLIEGDGGSSGSSSSYSSSSSSSSYSSSSSGYSGGGGGFGGGGASSSW
jgi:uncharacterized protein